MKKSNTEQRIYYLCILLEAWAVERKIAWLKSKMQAVQDVINSRASYNPNTQAIIEEAANATKASTQVRSQIKNRQIFQPVLEAYKAALKQEFLDISTNEKYKAACANAMVIENTHPNFATQWKGALQYKSFKDLLNVMHSQLQQSHAYYGRFKEKIDFSIDDAPELAVIAVAYYFENNNITLTANILDRLRLNGCFQKYRDVIKEHHIILLNKIEDALSKVESAIDLEKDAVAQRELQGLKELWEAWQIESRYHQHNFCITMLEWQIESFAGNKESQIHTKAPKDNIIDTINQYLFPKSVTIDNVQPDKKALEAKLQKLKSVSQKINADYAQIKATLKGVEKTYRDPERISIHSNITDEHYIQPLGLWERLQRWWSGAPDIIVDQNAFELGYDEGLIRDRKSPQPTPSSSTDDLPKHADKPVFQDPGPSRQPGFASYQRSNSGAYQSLNENKS